MLSFEFLLNLKAMKKMFFAPALFLFLFLLLPKSAHAQGTYSCGVIPYAPSDEKCRGIVNNCKSGYSPGFECRKFTTKSACEAAGPFPCIGKGEREEGEKAERGEISITCEGETGINTAIGCIPISNTNQFIGFILRWAMGIGGGIALLLIVVAGFQIMTSAGNPERVQAGKELLTSAIAGLIMLIFGVFILRVIGVDILGLGELGLTGSK